MKFKLFDIEINLSFVVTALFSIFILLDKSGNLTCCFASAFFHEAGHIFAMCRCKCKPEKVIIKLFDIRIIDCKRQLCAYKYSLIIILAGVTVNFILCSASTLIYFFSEVEIFRVFAIVNALTGAFNLLPVSNLDGGQALYLILSRKLSEKVTDRIIDSLTVIIILPTAVLGFIVLFRSKYNFSLLLISLYLLLALILKKSKFY